MSDDIGVRSVLVIVRGLLLEAIKAIDQFLDPGDLPAAETERQAGEIEPTEPGPE